MPLPVVTALAVSILLRTASSVSSLVAATRETPGLTCLRSAHVDLEGLVLDREVRALRDQFVAFNYSKILYNGLSPEREFLEASIDASQKIVNGQVRCRVYKGSFIIMNHSSETEKVVRC